MLERKINFFMKTLIELYLFKDDFVYIYIERE